MADVAARAWLGGCWRRCPEAGKDGAAIKFALMLRAQLVDGSQPMLVAISLAGRPADTPGCSGRARRASRKLPRVGNFVTARQFVAHLRDLRVDDATLAHPPSAESRFMLRPGINDGPWLISNQADWRIPASSGRLPPSAFD